MDLNPAFDYGSRTFSNIKRDLLRRADVVAPLWTDRDPSDFGMMLVDLWSYMGDIVHYYIDRASKEAFIQTATQKESVLAFANLYDYTPNFRTSAEATVYVANTSSASIGLPANTKFRVIDNDRYYYFYTPEEVVANPLTTTSVTVYEGRRTVEEVLTASSIGTPNQRYWIRTKDITPNSIRVYVYEGGEKEEWLRYNSIGAIPSGVPGYVINVNPEQEVEILFGDRASGRIPSSGTLITVSYTVSSGEAGNLPENSFIVFESNPSGELIIQGITASTGGSDGESVESIRAALQSVIRTQNRAVTLQDYRDLALTVNGVYDAVVSYEANTGSPSSGSGSVTVYPLPFVQDYLNLTTFALDVPEEMQIEIRSLLTANSVLGISVDVVEQLPLVATNISADIIVNDRYVNKWVKLDVETALDSLLDFQAVEFGKELRTGDVYRAIMNIEGVDSVDLTALVMVSDSGGTIVPPGELSPISRLRKGIFTLNVSGGIDTSI